MSRLSNWLSRDDSAPLHVEERGSGVQTLVFLAGLGGTTRYWASRVKPLEKHYRVVLVDLLGFGESPKPWTTYSVERHVMALRRVLAPLGPVSLVGHSLGALLAVAYAARHSDQVEKLIVMGMPVFGSKARAYRYLRHGPVKGGIVYTNLALTMIACLVTRRLLGRVLPYIVRSVPREVAQDLVKHTWRSSTSSLWEVVYHYDVAAQLAGLSADIGVLFIHGDHDVMAPLAPIELLNSIHPSSRLHVIPGADHHPFLRDTATCLSMIDGWIGRAIKSRRQVDPRPFTATESST